MEMHQLRYVVAVARARNFSRAAEQCLGSGTGFEAHVQFRFREQQIGFVADALACEGVGSGIANVATHGPRQFVQCDMGGLELGRELNGVLVG